MSNAGKAFVYVTYIRTTPEKLWEALTAPAFTKKFWFGNVQQTDWKPGSPWQLGTDAGKVNGTGEVLECDPPKRMVLRWRSELPDAVDEGYSRCTMTLEPDKGAVKLTLLHEMDRPGTQFIATVSGGWPLILSNLKSLLETGAVLVPANA